MSTNKKLSDWRCAVFLAPPASFPTQSAAPGGWSSTIHWARTPVGKHQIWLQQLEEAAINTDAGVCIFVRQPLPKWAATLHTTALDWQKHWRKSPWPIRCITVSSMAEAAWYAQALARTNLLHTMSLDTRLAALQRRLHVCGEIHKHWWGYRTSSASGTGSADKIQRHLRLEKAAQGVLKTATDTNTLLLVDPLGQLESLNLLDYQEKCRNQRLMSYVEFCAGHTMVG